MELAHVTAARYPDPPAPNTGLVVLQADALEMAPRRMLDTLRQLGPVRVVLVGPAFGSLAYRLALDVGFDEVWPAGLPTATFQALLAKAWAAPPGKPWLPMDVGQAPGDPPPPPAHAAADNPPPPARLPVRVDLGGGTCTVSGRVIVMPRQCLLLLDALLAAYPAAARRPVLSTAARPGRRIDMTVNRLRLALHASGIDTVVVESVRGVGYRLASRGRSTG